MWKKLLEIAKQIFALNLTVNRHTEQIDALKKEIHQLSEALRDTTNEVYRVIETIRETKDETRQLSQTLRETKDEVRRNAEREEFERERLLLQLENILLKAQIKPPKQRKLSSKRPKANPNRDTQE